MRILVTGGAGYVGSVSAELLLARGHDVTIVDSLVTGHNRALPDGAILVNASIGDRPAIEQALRGHHIEAVLHCASRALVGESVADPALYYRDNVVAGVAMLDAMRTNGVNRIVFSSSAAVYGAPRQTPIEEDSELRPVNPYGETKRAFEGALRWYGEAYGMRAVALRYFNVAGASEKLGEDHSPETHLIPNVLRAVEGGPPLTVHGTDYPTPDGTCIRDYIDVRDLASAHLAALELTASAGSGLEALNLGSGTGFSVRQVLHAAEAVTGLRVPHEYGPRRAGDPPVLVASNARAHHVLGWTAEHATLEDMIGSAWRWRQAHRHGYDGRSPSAGAPQA
jgi:UDP-glucose-4-epimerase GalE